MLWILGIAALIVLWGIATYNGLVQLRVQERCQRPRCLAPEGQAGLR